MGCHVSRLDSHGTTFPVRPLLFQRFEEIKSRRNAGRSLKDPTPSKKELLSHVDDENASQHHLPSPINPSKTKPHSLDEDNNCIKKAEPPPKGELKEEAIAHTNEMIKSNGNNIEYHDVKGNAAKDASLLVEGDGMNGKIEDAFTDADDDLEEDDDEDDNERMIGYEADEAFPGSPSFRVYFKEDDEVDGHIYTGKKDAFKETDSRDPPKESSVEKKVKRSKKKRSFRRVLPKNLLNVKSCYTPSHSSHHNNHLLPAKTTT